MPTQRIPWTRDEIILATDLYLRVDRRVPDSTDPLVIEIAEIINNLPLDPVREPNQPRRTPNAIEMKISNIRFADPDAKGGNSNGAKIDSYYWSDLNANPERLSELAAAIAATASHPNKPDIERETIDDDIVGLEGETLFKLHKFIERDHKLIRAKKTLELKKNGRLDCVPCGFNFFDTYGPVGQGFIECHHIIPLHQLTSPQETTLADLLLVCSNCHRMLHRGAVSVGHNLLSSS